MIMMTATATTTATPASSFYLCVGEYILWTRNLVGEDVDSIVLSSRRRRGRPDMPLQSRQSRQSRLPAAARHAAFIVDCTSLSVLLPSLLAAFLNCLRGRFLCPRCRRRCVEAQEACPRCRRRCVEALRALRQQWARSLGAGGVGQHAFPQQWARSLVEPVDVQYLFAILASDPVLHCVRATACLLLVRAPLLRRFRRHRTGENEKHNSVTRAR